MASEKKILEHSSLGPRAASYSQGIAVGDLVFVAGQVALGEDGDLVGQGDVEEQTRQVMARVEILLGESGATLSDLVAATVYLKHLDDFPRFDRVWREALGDHRPTRATVRADMVRPDLLVEIQAIAHKAS